MFCSQATDSAFLRCSHAPKQHHEAKSVCLGMKSALQRKAPLSVEESQLQPWYCSMQRQREIKQVLSAGCDSCRKESTVVPALIACFSLHWETWICLGPSDMFATLSRVVCRRRSFCFHVLLISRRRTVSLWGTVLLCEHIVALAFELIRSSSGCVLCSSFSR